MTVLESSAVASGLAETVRTKVQTAAAPLKLADVAKGLTKPKKVKAADFQQEIRQLLDEDVRLGRLHSCPSGKDDSLRYWSRDEKQVLQEKALALAGEPKTLPALKTALGKEVKGVAPAFVERAVRELVGADQLFEHPPKTKTGGPLFGSSPPPPPPPPLEQAKNKKALGKLVADCRKLVTTAGITSQDLVRALQLLLSPEGSLPTPQGPGLAPNGSSAAILDEMILKAVAPVPVLSLADLRRRMPAELQGRAFDEAVLRLADQRRVVISQDVDPAQFSEAEKAVYVKDGDALFTTIAKRD